MQYNIEELFHSSDGRGFTFLHWLMFCDRGQLEQARAEELHRRSIDAFVSNNVRIRPNKEQLGVVGLAEAAKGFKEKEKEQKSTCRVSETLATVYIKQKKMNLALSVYRQLSLENPEKSAYFANLIAKVTQEANQI